MTQKKIVTFGADAKFTKALEATAKEKERTVSFCIRKAVDFWLAHGAPDKIEMPKGGKKL